TKLYITGSLPASSCSRALHDALPISHAKIVRTDASGMCTIKNLAVGMQPVLVQFGTWNTSTKVVIAEGENELFVLKLKPPSTKSDRKSTRLNSSHVKISYAVFCLKKQ